MVEGRGIVLRDIDAGESLLIKGVDFGPRPNHKFTACVEGAATIEVRLDAADGPLVGTFTMKPGSGFREATTLLKGASGIHDLYFVFPEGGFRWDWWKMTK